MLFIPIALLSIDVGQELPGKAGVMRMGAIVRASGPGETIRQVWAYAEPNDGEHLIACGFESIPQANASYGYVYSSSDDGATWHRTMLDDATRWVTEESCAFGQDGRAYFVDGQSDTSTGNPRHEWGYLQVFVSQDRGMSWKPAARREFVDWTLSVALPADKDQAESLLIFGNRAADKTGHWSDKGPIALEATEHAQTLSKLVTAQVNSVANFGGGAVALPDRTALFAVAVTDPKYEANAAQHRQLNIFAYRPSERSLAVRATLRDQPGRMITLRPSIVRDAGHRFHGRLYAAWFEGARVGTDAQLWLATSDDNGYHWSSRPILSIADYRAPAGCPTDSFSRPPEVQIAVNRSGVLGVLWTQDTQKLLFAASTDGGATFQLGQLVAQQPNGKLSVSDAWPWNARSLAAALANLQGKLQGHFDDFYDNAHLGLSVRLRKQYGIDDFALTADAQDVFHALWIGIGNDGNSALLTRRIDAPSAASTTHPLLREAAPISACGEDTTALKGEELTPIPPLEFSGQTDISNSFDLKVDHAVYSGDSHDVAASVTLVNKTENTLRGPLALFALGLHSDFGVAAPLNASGVKEGHPFWNLSAAIPADGLPPKAVSAPIQLRFKIDQFKSVPEGDAVAMQVRVFATNAAP